MDTNSKILPLTTRPVKTLSLTTTRLLAAVSGDGLLFRFPQDLGTPEVLQLALRCAVNAGQIAVAYASPAANHLAATFAQGAHFDAAESKCLGLMTLAAALRKCHRESVLAYFSCPLGDVTIFQISLFDSNAVALGELESRELILEQRVAQSSVLRNVEIQRAPVMNGAEVMLVESPSHAVRSELLRLFPGQIALTTSDCSLIASPAEALRNSGANWGAWIDAEGASLQLFDRAGNRVDSEHVLQAIVLHSGSPGSKILLERNASALLASQLRQAGFKIVRSQAARREMALTMAKSGAVVGGGPSGRVWFGGKIPMADAMRALQLWNGGAACYLPDDLEVVPALSSLAA